MLLLAACADGDDSLDNNQRSISQGVIEHDCDTDAGYVLDTHAASPNGGLQIVGIYEARNNDAPWWADPKCREHLDKCSQNGTCQDVDQYCDREPKPHPAFAHVAAGAPPILVLASYEPTNWTITVEEGAKLERVILSGFYDMTATVPPGVVVERKDLGVAFQWFTDEELAKTCVEVEGPQYCEGYGEETWRRHRTEEAQMTKQLVAAAEAHTGEKLRAFAGCYSMSKISLGATE